LPPSRLDISRRFSLFTESSDFIYDDDRTSLLRRTHGVSWT
jgi:hypothetical protein